ncbi:MAG: ATP phosphoribosyltransferase regulatory subunit [Clostridia bacterium]|nr:ATP phosphoribosyltransferase regulatory subunit [Clostridia bacterium]
MREETLIANLRSLYEGAGYRAYRMRKFEEYSLYLENRDFLLSDFVITFSDMSGRLLALKPDVTLSIVKGSRATKDAGEKVYYLENVYRLDERTHEYREIKQMGLETLGDIDEVQTLEVLNLALKTLEEISVRSVMDISHMGLIKPLLANADKKAQREIMDALRFKSISALNAAMENADVSNESKNALISLCALPGDFETGLCALEGLCADAEYQKAVSDMRVIFEGLRALGFEKRVRLDFSIGNDLSYYTGVVFQGFIPSAHRAVLSGGRYDGLSQKFLRGIGALGFALYLNDLEGGMIPGSHADALVVYGAGADAGEVMKKAEELRKKGLSVRIEKKGASADKYSIVVEV